MATAWEYLALKRSNNGWFADGMPSQERNLTAAMNTLGGQGWELVGFIDTATGRAAASDDKVRADAYFKRPVPPQRSGVAW